MEKLIYALWPQPGRSVDQFRDELLDRLCPSLAQLPGIHGVRLAVADSAVNLDEREFFIEGIEHDISNGGHLQRTSFTLSAVPPQAPLMFGVSRAVGTPSVYSSPTGTASPYTEATTENNIFAY